MDIRQAIQKPWEFKVKCYYQERSADNIENPIILLRCTHTVKCLDGILIYPKPLKQALDIQSNNIRVRSLTFSLDGNLELADRTFLKELLKLAEIACYYALGLKREKKPSIFPNKNNNKKENTRFYDKTGCNRAIKKLLIIPIRSGASQF